MTQFVHLSDSKMVGRIRKTGIVASKTLLASGKGLYCTPVSMDFYRTHQWLRELKRSGVKSIHAVQFNLAPNTLVWVGHYNGDHIKVTAAEAAKIFHQHEDGLGLQVIVPRSISKSSITKIYQPSQVLGWRIHPEAKGKQPFCVCRFCNRGEINAYRVITEEKE